MNAYVFCCLKGKHLLLVMELWMLRAREFLSARSTHDNREVAIEVSLAEALSSSNSAPMNWRHSGGDRHRDREEMTLSERGCGVEEKPLRCPFVSVCHLFVLQGNFGFDSQDQIRCGVSQLPGILIDVVLHLQPHIVIHMSMQGGEGEMVVRGETQSKSAVDACDIFIQSQRSMQKNGAIGQVISWITLVLVWLMFPILHLQNDPSKISYLMQFGLTIQLCFV